MNEREKFQGSSKKNVELQEEILALKDKLSVYQARAYGFDVAKKFEIYNRNHYKNSLNTGTTSNANTINAVNTGNTGNTVNTKTNIVKSKEENFDPFKNYIESGGNEKNYWDKEKEANIYKDQKTSSALDELARQKGLWINYPTRNITKLVSDIDYSTKNNKLKEGYYYPNQSTMNNMSNINNMNSMSNSNLNNSTNIGSNVNNSNNWSNDYNNEYKSDINSNLRQYSGYIIKNGR